jgi:hypothetical protein
MASSNSRSHYQTSTASAALDLAPRASQNNKSTVDMPIKSEIAKEENEAQHSNFALMDPSLIIAG